jgi:hypothetical protein
VGVSRQGRTVKNARPHQLRSDILVNVEKVIQIVLPLNFRQSIIVVPVCRFDPIESFIHHEVYVGASTGAQLAELSFLA